MRIAEDSITIYVVSSFHLFIKCFLRTYCVPDPCISVDNTAVKHLLLVLHISTVILFCYYRPCTDLPKEVRVAKVYHSKPVTIVHNLFLTWFPIFLLCVLMTRSHLRILSFQILLFARSIGVFPPVPREQGSSQSMTSSSSHDLI